MRIIDKLISEKNHGPDRTRTGFTLMEVIVSLFIIMILTLGVYSLVLLFLGITNDNKFYVEAIEIANQRIEQIRNMPYSDVGVISGIPNGIIPQEEIISRSGHYTVNTYVTYFDDPADGRIGSTTPDTIPTDYKIATVKVSWQAKSGLKNVTMFSKVIPRTVETNEGYGLLKITVSGANAQPIPTAEVRVVNNLVNPPINVINLTDGKGELYLPATSSYQGYEITVTKTNEEPQYYYGTDRTYGTSTGQSPYHLTVTEGDMTEEAFTIDKLATLQIRTVTANLPENWPVNESHGGAEQVKPRLALDGADNLYFAWQSQSSASSSVFVQKYNSGAVKQWTDDIVINNTLFQENPDIAISAGGHSFIVWQDNSSSLKALTYAPGTRLARDKAQPAGAVEKQPNFALINSQNTYFEPILKEYSDTTFYTSTNEFAFMYPDFSVLADNLHMNIIPAFSLPQRWLSQFALPLIKDAFVSRPAQAAGNIVQTKIGNVAGWSSTLTAAFDNTPTAGNVIIAIAVHSNAGDTFNTPYNAAGNFTEAKYSNTNWQMDIGIWHKVAGAGEPKQVTLTCSSYINGGVMMLMEVSGLDTGNLVDVTAANDQTGSTGNTSNSGWTAVSTDSGFAVAASVFADNNFSQPNSSNWSSGSSDHWTQRLWDYWSTNNDGSLAVASMNITAAAAQRASLTLYGGGSEERNSVMVVYNLYNPDDVSVSATGTQIANVQSGQAGNYLGAAFVVRDLTGSRGVTGITLRELGTVNAQNDLANIKLFYDLDTSAPYDCGSESYSGTETQFGATDADGFSGANGTAIFNDSVNISTTKTLCLYTVLDTGPDAEAGETIDIQIDDPASDIAITVGNVIGGASVPLDGSTVIDTPPETHQESYRWRNDDGDETGATWRESEVMPVTAVSAERLRLRFKLTNTGSLPAAAANYRLEYGEKFTSCAAAAWTAVPNDESMHWRMDASAFIDDADPTTRQLFDFGGHTFASGEMHESANTTGPIVLDGNETTEIEFSIRSTANAADNPYCFRLTDAGTEIDDYDIYPEVTLVGDYNIYIKSLDSAGNTRWAVKRVNNDNSNAHQTDPRIALTENFGTATTVVVWLDTRNGNYDLYAQSFDSDGNKLWNSGDDLALTGSSTDEYSPALAIDSNDNVYIAWTEDTVLKKTIYLAKYDLSGSALWPEPKKIVDSLFDVYDPSLAIDSGNNLYLAYTEKVIGITTAYLARYDTDGAEQWNVRANQEAFTANQSAPACAVRGAALYVSWTDNRENNDDIYAQKFDLAGTALWTDDLRLNIETGTSSQEYSRLAVDSTGDPYGVWQDSRNGYNDIYATEFTDPGAIIPMPHVPLRVWGTKTVGITPLKFEYDKTFYTDANGQFDSAVEFDNPGYRVEIVAASSSSSIILRDPIQPLMIMPQETKTWYLYIE